MAYEQFEQVVCRNPLPSEPAKGFAVLAGTRGVVLDIRPPCRYGHDPCYHVWFADGTDRHHMDDSELATAEPQPDEDNSPMGCVPFFIGVALGAALVILLVWIL